VLTSDVSLPPNHHQHGKYAPKGGYKQPVFLKTFEKSCETKHPSFNILFVSSLDNTAQHRTTRYVENMLAPANDLKKKAKSVPSHERT